LDGTVKIIFIFPFTKFKLYRFDVPQVCLDNHVDPNNDREIQTEAGACLVVEPMIVLVLVVVLLVLCIVFMIWRQWERYYWKKREQEERQNPRPWGEYRMPYGDIPV
jgi:hypothetical protein